MNNKNIQKIMFGKSIKLIIDNLDKNQDNQFTLKFLDALLSCDLTELYLIEHF
jgi:uncharacterized protein YbbC (DUF1343 family)